MPGKPRIKGTQTYRVGKGEPTRYAFRKGLVMHEGKLMKERFGIRRNKAVEIAFVPAK